jgi:hypothetical protein
MIENLSQAEIVSNLQTLIATPQWIVFKELVEKNDLARLRLELTKALRDDTTNLEVIKRFQYRIDIFEETLNLPEKTIEALQNVETNSNSDPYYKTKEEILEDQLNVS